MQALRLPISRKLSTASAARGLPCRERRFARRTSSLGIALALAAPLAQAQLSLPTEAPIFEIDGQRPMIARQSSDLREDTTADVALPGTGIGLTVVPHHTTPSYTGIDRDPFWQVDLRLRRTLTTVAARGCEGFTSGGSAASLTSARGGSTSLVCNDDYDLTGAWMLVSDLPLPRNPWAASVAGDPDATISRFPIASNGYSQAQVATVNRTARYVRIQFAPGSRRALAIEAVDLRGSAQPADPIATLNPAFASAFPETRGLIGHLVGYRAAARFTETEFGRTQAGTHELRDATKTVRSIASRISRIDGNLSSAIRLLKKVEVVPNLKNPARVMKRTLETVRSAVKPLKSPAKRVKDDLKRVETRLKNFERQIRDARRKLVASAAWAAGEQTSVVGLHHCAVTDPVDPSRPVARPFAEPLEGYAGLRNIQFELTEINELVREVGASTKLVNDGVEQASTVVGKATPQLNGFDRGLAGIDRALNDLMRPLNKIDGVLARRVCVTVPFVGKLCKSVNDVLRDVQNGKNAIGLGALERIVDRLVDPVVNEVLKPLRAAFPRVPTFPAIADIALPSEAPLTANLTRWEGVSTQMRDEVNTPSIFDCSEKDVLIDDVQARTDASVPGNT